MTTDEKRTARKKGEQKYYAGFVSSPLAGFPAIITRRHHRFHIQFSVRRAQTRKRTFSDFAICLRSINELSMSWPLATAVGLNQERRCDGYSSAQFSTALSVRGAFQMQKHSDKLHSIIWCTSSESKRPSMQPTKPFSFNYNVTQRTHTYIVSLSLALSLSRRELTQWRTLNPFPVIRDSLPAVIHLHCRCHCDGFTVGSHPLGRGRGKREDGCSVSWKNVDSLGN